MTGKLALLHRAGLAAFVLLTFGLSWSIWIGTWLCAGQPGTTNASVAMMVAIYAGSFVPGISAAIVSAIEGRASLATWLGSFVRFRCGWRAYLVALVPIPIAMLALTVALGYTPRLDAGHGCPPIAFYLTLFPISVFNGIATAAMGAGPLGEEGGWRGYLLPRLLERGGGVRASLVIGLIWSLWHLPIMAMFTDWRNGVSFSVYLPLYMAGVIALSFVMTSVWRLGGASLVPCIWLHGIINAVGGMAFEPWAWSSRWSATAGSAYFALALWLVAGALLLTERKWRVYSSTKKN
ncbi:CPBP family intramembrane metalloprotease [Sphingomonas koreensis]|nr:CPBP family intramembrane metalloprotease [Sphingomonas koreensis]